MSELHTIQCEIFIAAAPETVFRFLVEAAAMAEWLGSVHALAAQPGGALRVEIQTGNIAAGHYMEVVPPRRVAFTWGWEGGAALPPGRSLVEIDLTPEAGGTRLHLRHSGLPGDADIPSKHLAGWTRLLGVLADTAARLPPSSNS